MRFIIPFLLIIFLSSSTSMGIDFPPVKTGTRLVCRDYLPHIYLIEFISFSRTKTHNPIPIKKTKKGTYYMFKTTKEKYSSNNDSIVVKTSNGLGEEDLKEWQKSWTLIIDRSNLEFEIKGYLREEKCESVDKKTFEYEINDLKWEIESHNKRLDEHYKKTNKI